MSQGITNGQIFDKIAKSVGAMPKIWGEFFPMMVENREVAHAMHILSRVYGYNDVHNVFFKTVHDNRMEKASKMALGFYEAVG